MLRPLVPRLVCPSCRRPASRRLRPCLRRRRRLRRRGRRRRRLRRRVRRAGGVRGRRRALGVLRWGARRPSRRGSGGAGR
ncbi:hypothetical protein E8A74_21000 [Polyangium fumosum]|uniref:Uncharacterized protein n=1 Tax=Polyangium fumosum TaxID=889272 RepID=A0A4U1JAI6_9BACT|nr:hypothetical protein E8A74_21000 [Polyangium fumosum]